MKKKYIKIPFIIYICFQSFLYCEEPKNTELSIEEARGLYSLLENIKGQNSLFPEEVNAENLKTLLKSDYTNGVTLYEKNPYALNIFNCIFIEVKKNNLIGFETFVSTDSSQSTEECIKIANEWNNRHSFATVSFSENEFYIQYFMSFIGGIHADNFNYTIDWVLASSFHFENFLKEYLKNKSK